MATNTYVALDKVTVGTATASVTFSSISSAYTDLVIVASGTATAGGPSTLVRFNGDTTSNYSYTYLTGDGTSSTSGRGSTQTSIVASYNGAPFSSPNTNIIQVMNYTNTTTFKTVICRAGQTSYGTDAIVGLWRKTPEAITSITLTTSSSTYAAGSTFSLYGIAASGAGAKATGGTVYSDSQYYYHAFTANGTFTPTQSLTCDYLVVAGGAGGGAQHGGGGGAGGLRSTVSATGGGGSLESAVTLASATAYAVTVGAGGAGSTSISNRGLSGTNSSFIGGVVSITSTGGGGGGSRLVEQTGSTGGSGGGGGFLSLGGSGTANQGVAGGNDSGNRSAGGGGGGASAVGGNSAVGSVGGNGGSGVATSITGSSVSYAGGGGGGSSGGGAAGTGGSGGGGAGSTGSATGTAGTTNLGGGGGGGGFDATAGNGGNGGSGIVIIRYAK